MRKVVSIQGFFLALHISNYEVVHLRKGLIMLSYLIKKCRDTEEIIVENGIIKVIIVPQQGGRVLEFSRENLNALFRNPKYVGIKGDIKAEETAENWLNCGGYKGWPAPQTKWAWPPIFALDLGTFTYEIFKREKALVVILSSPISSNIDFKFIREITIEDNCDFITVKETMVNLGEKVSQWAVWGNTQVVSPGYADIKLNSDVFTGGITFYQDFDMPSSNAYSVRKENGKILRINCTNEEKFKIGVVTDSETIEYHCLAYDRKLLFRQNFKYEGQVAYPLSKQRGGFC